MPRSRYAICLLMSTATFAHAEALAANGTGETPRGTPGQAWFYPPSGPEPVVPATAKSVALGDFDNDGDLDVVIATQGTDAASLSSNRILINNGSADFGNFTDPFNATPTVDVVVRDFDGNGLPDIVEANGSANLGGTTTPFTDHLWLTFPKGGNSFFFSNANAFVDVTSESTAVAAGDLDGDGDPDLLFGRYDGTVDVWINRGGAQGGTPGSFLAGQSFPPANNNPVIDIAVGDFNQDGRDDAVWVQNDIIRFHLSDPVTGMLVSAAEVQGFGVTAIAIGDLDQAAGPDIAVAQSFSSNSYWANVFVAPGLFVVTPAAREFPPNRDTAIAIANLDGMGFDDVLLTKDAASPFGAADPEPLADAWLNQVPVQPDFEHRQQCFARFDGAVDSLATGDLDGDMDTDVFMLVKAPAFAFASVYLNGQITTVEGCCAAESAQRITRPRPPPPTPDVDQPFNLLQSMGAMAEINLPALRLFRDLFMLPASNGSQLAQDYVDLTPDLLQVMNQDAQLKILTNDTLRLWQSNIDALLAGNGASTVVTNDQVDAADALLNLMSIQGSAALAQKIAQERARLLPFAQFVGMDMQTLATTVLGSSERIFADGFDSQP